MLPCVCSVIDRRRCQNVVGTSVTHSAIASCATFLFLPHFDVICNLLLNRQGTKIGNQRTKKSRQAKQNKPSFLRPLVFLPDIGFEFSVVFVFS